MGIPKKGARKLIVKDIEYRWRVSRYRLVSDWRIDTEIVDKKYLGVAKQFGLGDVADVIFTIAIERYNEPQSKLIVKYYGLIIDGFLGPEQLVQIKPSLVKTLILESLSHGWHPGQKGDFTLDLFENTGSKLRPAILVLPGINDSIRDYENLIKPIKLEC